MKEPKKAAEMMTPESLAAGLGVKNACVFDWGRSIRDQLS